jgi:hypothetical protein
MTRKQAVDLFTQIYPPFNDYWELQLQWTVFLDEIDITEKQRSFWINPCTPKTFKNFNRKFRGVVNE